MECKNKTKYIKNLDIVRKCHCTKKCYWLLDATTQPDLIKYDIISSNINEQTILNGNKHKDNMDDLMMMMGDDPSVYQSLPVDSPSLELEGRTGDAITNTTNQMLDVVNDKRQRKGNRRQNNQRNRNRQRNNNNNNQNDGASFDDSHVISAFNRTSKIYNKLRKNDAVKVIDTPSGRAGFVYQSSSSNNNQDFPMGPSIKETNTNWEDSYSQNQFVNRNANDVKLVPDDTSNKKIMPVLTSDGKIALVVRGDTSRYFDESQHNGTGNSVSSKKYEPITNLTSIITALNSNNDNNINSKQNDSINVAEGLEAVKTIQEQNRLINRLDDFFASVTNKVKKIEEVVEHELGIDVEDTDEDDDGLDVTAATTTTTTTEAPYDEEDHKKNLLQINRPLSEVLGLPKKTHYHHPHDPLHATSEAPYTRSSHTTEIRRINTPHKTSTHIESVLTTTDSAPTEEFDHESPEVINIAVIPGFDSEMEERLFGKNKDNVDRNLNEVSETSGAISSIHCAMQAMVAIACAFTVFGVLGAYYKVEIVNQVRVIYWWLVVPFNGRQQPTSV